MLDEEKDLGERELQSQFENEEEERQHRETLTPFDIESKEQRRLQEESRKKILFTVGECSHTGGIRVLCNPFSSKRWMS